MSNTYNKLDDKINKTYLQNLEDLTKETAATLSVQKDVSHKSVNKTQGLLVDILNKDSVKDYPLDWNFSEELKKITDVESFPSDVFSGLKITNEQMTYITPTGASELNPIDKQKINTLNPLWKRINYILVGSNSDINITRTFFMISDTTATSTTQMLSTIPGQEFSQTLSTEEFSSFPCFKNGPKAPDTLFTIKRQADPFYGGLKSTSGF
jgi:hypothetical protein